jgi:hypothetical protein
MGFAYASDTRGSGPFFPRVDGRRLRTLQLPTTLPTLDEVLGLDDADGEGFVARVRRAMRDRAWSVLTLHAEMEGRDFQGLADRLLSGLREDGVMCLPLEVLADRIRAEGQEKVAVAEVLSRPIRGRAGTVAMPAGLEVV